MLNKVIQIGRMVKDIDIRQTGSGKDVGTFTIAIDNGYGDNKTTDFINCVAWEKRAEFISKHFGKGRLIGIIGRMSTRSWEDEAGKKRYATEVVVNETFFTGEKKEDTATESTYEGFAEVEAIDDDLPF